MSGSRWFVDMNAITLRWVRVKRDLPVNCVSLASSFRAKLADQPGAGRQVVAVRLQV